MSRHSVATEAVGGGDRASLDVIGEVEALRFSTSVNGDLAASWQMRLDPRTSHRGVQPGRTVIIPTSLSSAWRGVLGNPRRGDVWDFNASGVASLANNYTAVAATTGNSLKLDEVTDAAIARGLPWTRPSSLPSMTDGNQGSGAGTITDSLNTVCDAKGQLWNVSRTGAATAAARPTAVAYILQANDTAGGRTVTGFATDVHVTYLNSSTYATTTVTRSATARPYGRFEQPLDITDLGPITATQAQSHGDNWLAKRGGRLQFTAPFSITPGQLLNPGGSPVDLATVQASDGLVRVILTDPDTAAGELALGAVQITPGETDYDSDADVLTLTPLDRTPTGLAAVFA